MLILMMIASLEDWKGGEIAENLRMPIKAEFVSSKSLADLELCIADSMSTSGTVSTIRDGQHNVVILAAQPRDRGYIASAYLSPTGNGTKIQMRIRNNDIDDRMRSRFSVCL